MNILVTGGFGYIGSNTVVKLIQSGHKVVILDNLVNSFLTTISKIESITKKGVPFFLEDCGNTSVVISILKEYSIDTVIHFAGLKSVTESVLKPIEYYNNNVAGTLSVLLAMKNTGVTRLVFSSSAAVYGITEESPITELHSCNPVNSYGQSKYLVEKILKDVCTSSPMWKVLCLRYFNPIGSDTTASLGDNPKSQTKNLIPLLCRVAQGEIPHVDVYGDNFNTRDGTGVRDYIHVEDVAQGHLAALTALNNVAGFDVVNLGTSKGYTVLEVIKTMEKVSKKSIPFQICSARRGEIDCYYADVTKANNLLGWKATHDLESMCSSAWHFANNKGLTHANNSSLQYS